MDANISLSPSPTAFERLAGIAIDPIWGVSNISLLFCAIFTIPLYFVFIIALFRNRRKPPYNSSFFTLAMSLAIADLVALFNFVFMH